MSSDSSDDENLEFLKEAQDNQFINDSMFGDNKKENKVTQSETLPASLRKSKDEDEQFNLFKVTPQFRQHVAKHLDRILDSSLKYKELKVADETYKKKTKQCCGGVKLFSSSERVLDLLDAEKKRPEVHEIDSLKRADRYRKLKVKVDEESLREVVVTGEDILSRESTKQWSRRGKAPIFEYKKQENGQFVLVEPVFE
nr:unnamed protein product [Callosobruchus chinensis]